MTDQTEIKVFAAALTKEVILSNGIPGATLSPARFIREFDKIYDFVLQKLEK